MTITPPFEHLLAAHMSRAHRVALGYLGHEQEAREAAQDALLKAYRARDRYDPKRPFYPWFYRIVKNTCLDAISRRKHRAVPGLDDERVAGPTESPGERLDQHRAVQKMKRAMGRLSDEHREVLTLRHFEGLSYAEIASLLDVAAGTVMSRLYRARRALVAEMESS